MLYPEDSDLHEQWCKNLKSHKTPTFQCLPEGSY